MSQSTATLGGVTLRGAKSYDWELRAGVLPVERLWQITARHAGKFASMLGAPQELVLTGPKGSVRIQNIYPLEILPGPNPHLKFLRVADRRWLWPRTHVASTFNARKVTPTNFLVNDSGLIENAVLQPDIRYRKQTLFPVNSPGVPWTATQVIEHVLGALGTPVRYQGPTPSIEVLDLPLDDPGDAAVSKVLSYFPGCDLYVDVDGAAVVYDTTENLSKDVLPRFARKQADERGDLEIVYRTEIAPSAFFVLFTPEVEVRFDYSEGGSRTADSNVLENVIPSPDATLTLSTGKKVARGSLIDIEVAFGTWGAFGLLARQLSFAILCYFGMAGSLLEQVYSNDPNSPFDPVAAGRYRAVQASWRRLFQISPTFMSRIESIRAVRAAILNTETGVRAPSEVYCDFTRRPSAWGFAKAVAFRNQGWAVEGYADALEDGQVAPARVLMLDPVNGVFRVEPQLDPWGLADAIILGYPENDEFPTQSGESDANRTGNEAYVRWAAGRLSQSFQLATVLTVVPGSPNDLRRFHTVELSSVVGNLVGTGPPVYIRINPAVMTARFSWSDAAGPQIIAAIKGTAGASGLPPDRLVNGEDVRAVAEAAVKRAAQFFLPRLSGSASVDLDPDMKPTASLGSVTHSLEGGAVVTRGRATAVNVPADISRYLPANTRARIFRLPEDGAAS